MKVHKQLSMWASQPEARFQITVILKTNQVFVSYLHGWSQALDELGTGFRRNPWKPPADASRSVLFRQSDSSLSVYPRCQNLMAGARVGFHYLPV
jgi:hypothetical protein